MLGFSTRPTTSGSPRAGRSRPIFRSLLAGAAIAILAVSLWLATRFDPLGRARSAYEHRRYPTALRAALGHLKWFPHDRTAAVMAARCLTRMGRASEAETYYSRAEPLDPDDLRARAAGLLQINDPDRAATVLERLLLFRPEDGASLRKLAAIRMARKDWRAVLTLADRLRDLPSERVAGATLAAIAHHEQKHNDRAAEAAREVLRLDPDLKRLPLPRSLFWNNLALDLMAIGRAEEARQGLERELAVAEDAGLMELLGVAYSHLGQIDQAERCWREAERRDPNNADLCLDLGRLALRRGRKNEAVAFFERAARLSPDAVEPLYSLSQAHRLAGRIAEADRYRRLADDRRRALPPRNSGMGADVEPDQTASATAAPLTETDR